MEPKAKIMDEMAINRALARISHEIIEKNPELKNVCIFGVKRKGVPLAESLCKNIKKFFDIDIPMGVLDVTNHRDDLTDDDKIKNAGQSSFPCDINDKIVIIVDDVLYTGRTVRAANETIFSAGRPKCVQLVTLIDRGHRELPLRPDYIGKNVPTAKSEIVKVIIDDINNETGVYIYDK